MNKTKADLLNSHTKYIKAQEDMFGKLTILQQECNNELCKLLKRYGYRGTFTPSSLNFHSGILIKDWKIGTYMICDYRADKEDRFILTLMKLAPKFYAKFGIKIILRSMHSGEWITLPE